MRDRFGLLMMTATLLTGALAAIPPASASPVDHGAAQGIIVTHTLTNAAGSRAYQVYTPRPAQHGRPLVVWLHGASKVANGDSRELRRTTSLLREADRRGFSVAAPMQSLTVDRTGTWRATDPANVVRGRGESSIIADIIRQVIRDLHVDPSRVYLVGHSAGGAMTENVGALYPELFAGIAVIAGLPYLADPSGVSLKTARHGAPMPTFVVDGDRDQVIPAAFGDLETTAALGANGIPGAPVRATVTVARSSFDRYPTVIRTYGTGRREVIHARVIGAGHPTGPGGLTLNGPALDDRVISFLLTKKR
ncbi:alpha/beta fold hydrolase [Gordonia sp. SID5947]|uniref:extracellular catalytic domain type 1 short-chain-length polyhydroxyalkanoate depolymerase n=1 Tax=Gordonia sp. SID5947 TaxID=2690315 RepID=UPI0013707F2C|nr:alpha/beta fold hydrolase [Gordonia sp. SID5947]MYR05521.1 alpha/beta fold hydrolase [Gordonia sp. SID5947]